MALLLCHHHGPRSVTVAASVSNLASPASRIRKTAGRSNWPCDFGSKPLNLAFSVALALGISLTGSGLSEAKVRVNRPELLPKEFTTVIDVGGFLSAGQVWMHRASVDYVMTTNIPETRVAQEIADIEKDTGFKVRLLAQNYPETPGLAIKDFWQVDERTIVFVADPTFGNILNFNVGAAVDLDIPRSFWSRLAGKYGNLFYWKEKGEDASIEAAVMAISNCLREPVGPNNCSELGTRTGKHVFSIMS